MIIDYRVYATLYALLAVAWIGAFHLISKAKPGLDTFYRDMAVADRYMRFVVAVFVAVALANFADWLWS